MPLFCFVICQAAADFSRATWGITSCQVDAAEVDPLRATHSAVVHDPPLAGLFV